MEPQIKINAILSSSGKCIFRNSDESPKKQIPINKLKFKTKEQEFIYYNELFKWKNEEESDSETNNSTSENDEISEHSESESETNNSSSSDDES
jgi:hypothetical protein